MIKIGVFGGAFNPVHNGHVNIAQQAFKLLKLDKMLIIPTGASPHKNTPLLPYQKRAEMCRLAFDGDKYEICDLEAKSKGKSYTLNTIRALKAIYPDDAVFYLIIGGDMLLSFESWFHYESILKECKVVAAARNNVEYVNLLEYATKLGRVKVLNIPVVEASSTEIRLTANNGGDISQWVPEKVSEYIKENKLYRSE